jgi:enoyl-CoA hydratase/carnithine racemase
MTERVTVTSQASVPQLVLNRPDKKNALTAAMYASLAEALLIAGRNPQVRAALNNGGR